MILCDDKKNDNNRQKYNAYLISKHVFNRNCPKLTI